MPFSMQIYAASSDSDILKCWPVMHLLRPHLMEGQFLSLIRNMMAGGYRLAFIEEAGIAAAAIGYRYQQKLYDGKQIYVDDLTTLAGHRAKVMAVCPLPLCLNWAYQKNLTISSLPFRSKHSRLPFFCGC